MRRLAAVAAVVGWLASVPAARAAVVTLAPSKDNTLYQNATGSLSNGAGQYFFVGRVDAIGGGAIHRGVIAFDVASTVPAGAVVTRVDLTLSMSRTTALMQPVSLHRLLAAWGEGTSDAPLEEGRGVAATTGDATWLHRFYPTDPWTGAGAAGDFAGAASTTIQVGPIGAYTFLSTPALVADVQGWLDSPATNFGWILIGNEAVLSTAKRFDTRENPLVSARPSLTVEFSTGQPGAGSVPDGSQVPGTPLTVEHAAGGNVRLSWGGSCAAGDSDFEVYAGDMRDFTVYVPKSCSTGGATTLTFAPAAASEFYLVVPRNTGREGSYGTSSAGQQRPASASACLPQAIAGCP